MVYSLYIFTLIFTPLAFGTVDPWALMVMESSIFVATLLFLVQTYIKKDREIIWPVGFTPLLLFVAFIYFQFIELPSGLVKILSPKSHELRDQTIGLLDPLPWFSISVNRKATLIEFFRFSSYACFYFLTVQLMNKQNYLKRTINIIVVLGGAMALQALLQQATSPDKIYWLFSLHEKFKPLGPFAYRNHYAGFMVMLCPLTAALFLYNHEKIITNSRYNLIYYLTRPELGRNLLLGFSLVLMASSIFISSSRGGIISLCVAMGGLLVWAKKKSTTKIPWGIGIPFIALMVIFVGWFSWELIVGDFSLEGVSTRNLSGRSITIKATLQAIIDYFLIGSGLGTFPDLFPIYLSSNFWMNGLKFFYHTHSDYFELFATGGLIGVALLGCFFILIIKSSVYKTPTPKEHFHKYSLIGAKGGIIAILIHNIVDFHFFSGALALYFYFFCGIIVTLTRNINDMGKNHKSQPTQIKLSHLMLISVFVLFILFAELNSYKNTIQAQNIFKPIKEANLFQSAPNTLSEMKKIGETLTRMDPLESDYHLFSGKVDQLLGNSNQSVKSFYQATVQTPTSSNVIQTLGIEISRINNKTGEQLLLEGLKLAPRDISSYFLYTEWLIQNNRQNDAEKVVADLIQAKPSAIREMFPTIINFGLNLDNMTKALPNKFEMLVFVATMLEENGFIYAATNAYDRCVVILKEYPGRRPWDYSRIFYFFWKNNRMKKALEVTLLGSKTFPHDDSLQEQYRKAYEKNMLNNNEKTTQ